MWLRCEPPANAQELEPRAYSPSPVGVTFLVVGYAHSVGDVLFDPSLPFEGVEARLDYVALGLGYDNRQDNVRIGATLSLPLGRQQSLKFNYSKGAVTRIGGNFDIIGVAWQKVFF